MGLETPADYGGAECSFMAAILAVEGKAIDPLRFGSYLLIFFLFIELAKIDPSISALCDIHVSLFFFFFF